MKIFIRKFLLELFYVLSAAIFIAAVLEIIWPGIILAYLNLNYLLIFWLIIGIITILL